MTISPRRRVEETIRRAQIAEGLERLWAALLWPTVSVSAAVALILSGALSHIPPWPRLAVIVALGIVFLASLQGLFRLAWPDRPVAMRRVELRSGLAHRPVSALDDRLARGCEDPHQVAIWEEHRLRQIEGLGHVRAGAPISAWRDLDRFGLRLPAFLALLASLLLGTGQPAATIAEAVRFAPGAPTLDFTLDAWLTPPAYTGRAPLVLTSPAMIARLKSGADVSVPENSVLSLRLAGASSPQLRLLAGEAEVPGLAPTLKSEGNLFRAEVKMSREAVAVLLDGDSELARWPLKLIADEDPTVAFAEPPSGDSSGMLSVKWKAGDDYGVTGVAAEIDLADIQDDGIGFESNGIFLYKPPAFPIVLNRAAPKDVKATARADMAEHPWAGFMVEMTLTVRDAAGQATRSAAQTFRLPERIFYKPLARALIEQRRALILAPERQGKVEQMLDAMMTYPDGLFEGSGQYLAVAAIAARLRATADRDDVDVAVNMLWQTAVGIEDGVLSDIRAELEALRKELERAIEEGAPPERIAELTQRLREAMQRYMQSLADEMARDRNRGQAAKGAPPDARTVTPEELQRMLDRIEKLAKNGANDAARELLSQLDDILRNLRPGMQNQARQGSQPLAQMLDQLSDLMRRQQRLMDDTQRMAEPGEEPLGEEEGMDAGSARRQYDPEGLAGDQGDLARMLDELLRQLGQNGLEAPPPLGGAGEDMRDAEGALREADRDRALNRQGDAMEKLRESAAGMAQQLVRQGQGQQGSYGRHGQARGDAEDPLGRPLPTGDEEYGPNRDMLSGEIEGRRAREILQELRQRLEGARSDAGRGRPPIELDYLDRLLRGLY